VAKLYRRLGADPLVDGELPDKPKRMRWTTYARIIAELVAAQRAADRAPYPPRGTEGHTALKTRKAPLQTDQEKRDGQ